MAFQKRESDENVFIADTAVVVGDVTLGKGVSVWFQAVVRGDEGPITVGENTNIQDAAILHAETHIGKNCTIGHGAIVLNGAKIGSHCLVGAGALVTGKMDAPDGSMILGSPAKVIRPLTEAELADNQHSVDFYANNVKNYR